MNGSASGARTRPGSAAPRLASKTIETESLRGTRDRLGLTLVWMQSPRATLNVVSLIAAAVLLRTCSARCAKHGA